MENKIVKFLKSEVEKIKKNPNEYMLKDRNATKHILYWCIGCGDHNTPEITNLSRIIMAHILTTMIPRLDKENDISKEAGELRDLFIKAEEIFK